LAAAGEQDCPSSEFLRQRAVPIRGGSGSFQERPTEFAYDEHIGLPRDRLAGRSAMLAHHIERFCPAHAGETARKSDGASQHRAVQFNDCHQSPSAATKLPSGAGHL
jgi:hypothetical protein